MVPTVRLTLRIGKRGADFFALLDGVFAERGAGDVELFSMP
jgi:hypothetical protein